MSQAKIGHPIPGSQPLESQQSSEARKRAKTKAPASVRARERKEKENIPQAAGSQSHTAPVLTEKSSRKSAVPDYLAVLMGQVQDAILNKKWNKLGLLIEGIADKKTGLDLRTLSDHPAVKQTLEEAAIGVLAAGIPPTDDQISLTLDLLNMGADWNARDDHGDSVLKILRRHMDDDILQFIVDEYPNFLHLFVDREGRPIPAD